MWGRLPLAACLCAAGVLARWPPPHQPENCTCSSDYPFCWDSGLLHTKHCYRTSGKCQKSETVCPGNCTDSFVPEEPPPPPPPPQPWPQCQGAPLRVLFVGNSFTYGPRPGGRGGPGGCRTEQREQNNLPLLFKLVAESLGRCVTVAEDTIGACTLYTHRPSANPDGCAPCDCHAGFRAGSPVCTLTERAATPEQCSACGCGCAVSSNRARGLTADANCTVQRGVWTTDPDYHPCPQLAVREQWDLIVVQDHSALPTVPAARRRMLDPAVEEYAAIARRTGAKLAVYMTHAYEGGISNPNFTSCPGGIAGGCFPYGTLTELVQQTPNSSCHAWQKGVKDFACMTYSLARGYAEAAMHGGDLLIPCGPAWQAARGIPQAAADCRAAVDADYDPAAETGLPPFRASNVTRWSGDAGVELYRWLGNNYTSKYCTIPGCYVDEHPSILGMYLNALVFYATIFRESPVGAAYPAGQMFNNVSLPGATAVRASVANGTIDGVEVAPVTAEEAALLQRVAADVVLPDIAYWNPGGAPPPAGPPPAPPAPAPPPAADCLRVLFVGDSLTYGPSPAGQAAQNNVPRLFKLAAQSLGQCVTVAEDTIGGCTLYAHRPSANPDGCAPCDCRAGGSPLCTVAERGAAPGQCSACGCACQVAGNARVAAAANCTVGSRNLSLSGDDHHACPQLLLRGDCAWDVVVLQDASVLPTVGAAREEYLYPAVREYAARASLTGAKVAVLMPHADYAGHPAGCPGAAAQGAGCWPLGELGDLAAAAPGGSCDDWQAGVADFPCMTYAVARGSAQAALYGADVLIPAGLAWHVARGAPPVADACRAAADAGYADAGDDYNVTANLTLPPLPPLPPANATRWAGDAGRQLYAPDGAGGVAREASVLGAYLDALVVYAALFKQSPVGAAAPAGEAVDGEAVPGADAVRGDGAAGAVTADEAAALQRAAEATVLPHLAWWHPGPEAPTPAPTGAGGVPAYCAYELGELCGWTYNQTVKACTKCAYGVKQVAALVEAGCHLSLPPHFGTDDADRWCDATVQPPTTTW